MYFLSVLVSRGFINWLKSFLSILVYHLVESFCTDGQKKWAIFEDFFFSGFFFWISSIRNSNDLFSGFPCFENNLLQRLNLKSNIDGSFSRHVGYLCTLSETATLLQSWPLFGAIVVNLFWNFDLSRSFLYKLSCSSLRALTFFFAKLENEIKYTVKNKELGE